MKRNIIRVLPLYSMWLGFSLGVVGIGCWMWQFYFVLIPTVVLVVFKYEYGRDEIYEKL